MADWAATGEREREGMPLLLASQGAKFRATIRKADVHFEASFEIVLTVDGRTQSESGVQVFDTAAAAESWLNTEAKLRGFE